VTGATILDIGAAASRNSSRTKDRATDWAADQSVGAADWQIVAAARAALDAHGVLEAAYDSEPDPLCDAVSWTSWHTEVLLPAHHTWQATIDCLEILLGEAFPGRDGSDWFAICLRILTAEQLPVAGRLLRRADREPDRLGPGSAARVPAGTKQPLEGLPSDRPSDLPAATAPSTPHLSAMWPTSLDLSLDDRTSNS
jgi:hypothetical protein